MNRTGTEGGAILDTHGWVLVLNKGPSNKHLDEGIEVLRLATAQSDAPAEAHYHLGEALLQRSQPLEAVPALEMARNMVKSSLNSGDYVPSGLAERIDAALAKAKKTGPTTAATAAEAKY